MRKEMPACLGFIITILGCMGSQSLLHFGALSVRLERGLSSLLLHGLRGPIFSFIL